MKIILWHSCQGSPPHRRGKVGLDGGLSEAVGITPAQAGKSKLALCTPSCPTDHPCAGGEKNKELEGVWLPMGSPPRGRGKVLYRVPEVVPVRITPAWAGKSLFLPVMVRLLQDHPRVGGEKVSEKPTRANCARITPAWAGKSLNSSALKCCVKDHPRVGGEKVMCNSRDGARLGSPPRGRGKAAPRQRAHLARWITPAWAGKSQLKQTGLTMQEDHPRVGGEKISMKQARMRAIGSPPRGRGKAVAVCWPLVCTRITPAWAGKSCWQ